MAMPPDFAEHCLYARRSWFVDDVIHLDPEDDRIVALMRTTDLGAIVDDQIVKPGHPKHVPGAAMVQATATLGMLHAVYVMGLRGWAGFGTHIKEARFGGIGVVGPDVILNAEATRRRKIRGTWFVDYSFRFTQGETELYRSKQTAAWVRDTR